jgi:hypothetical protein
MQVSLMCTEDAPSDPQHTLPRKDVGANTNLSKNNGNAEGNEASGDEKEEEAAMEASTKYKPQRQKWTVLGQWNANELLARVSSAIKAEVLRLETN